MKTMKTNQEQNNAQQKVKEVYEKPQIEIIEIEMEGILCGSRSSGSNYPSGGGIPWG